MASPLLAAAADPTFYCPVTVTFPVLESGGSPPPPSLPFPSLPAVRVWIVPTPDVREGGRATLTCAVAGGAEEVLSYSWYRNGVWLSSGPSPALTLPRVAAPDAGSYHCSIRTPARNRSATPATLNVLCESPGLRGFLSGGDVQGKDLGVSPAPGSVPLAGEMGDSKVWLRFESSMKISPCPRG
ncbi:hypothetical protein WISP_149400 [Willisornis vidua]|uniref:Ig-like domain-containing protein n=1 Tax=Willisornis vidua TaxID=1566151 RepID=A0ABQ9CJX4_9PASS|nr:hypothetical protein WISP_149400 [Willisornis vidua]